MKKLFLVFTILALTHCTSSPEEEATPYVEKPVDELYNTALNHLDKGEYKKAAKGFEEVEQQHPYSIWAQKSQLMAAYAYYQRNDYDDAIIALDNFIKLHPGHKDIPYAYFLRGLSYYEQISDVTRDQKITREAEEALKQVIDRFPTSEYAKDAKYKLDLVYDHLAGKEMEVGRYYLKKRHYTAAINRFLEVVTHYQTSTHTPEALHRLVECYLALGFEQEAQKAAAVLGHNFPNSEWYRDSYRLVKGLEPIAASESRSWFGWVF